MGTTANYSWPYPESSDFVADGATAIENLADAVDLTVYQHRGLQFLHSSTFNATSHNVPNVFTNTYTNYRVLVTGIIFASPGSLQIQMLNGTTPSTANHYWAYTGILAGGASMNSGGSAGSGAFTGIQTNVGGVYWGTLAIDFHEPQLTTRRSTGHVNAGFYNGDYYGRSGAMIVDSYASFDGFRLWSSVSVQGAVRVYGYEQ